MKLITLKCSTCGSQLEVENGESQIKCGYCGTTSIIDDENKTITHIVKDINIEEKLENARVFLDDIEDYEKALKIYINITEEKPGSTEAWQGIIKAMTKKFSDYSIDRKVLEKYYSIYIKVEKNQKEKTDFTNKYNKYLEKLEQLEQVKNNEITEEDYKFVVKCVLFIIITFIIILITVMIMEG